MKHVNFDANCLMLTVCVCVFQEIDDYIVQAKEKSYETMVNLGRQSLSVAASVAVTAAVKVVHTHTHSLEGELKRE